jgi:P4 family phage/plasmid primase-like protien
VTQGVNPQNRIEEQVRVALDYHRRGWAVIPVPWGQKSPGRTGWQHQRFADEAAVVKAFSGGPKNIGVLLGPASGNLVDCDQDDPFWASMAGLHLPTTATRFGRPSKPGGHRLYTTDEPMTMEVFADPVEKAKGGLGIIGEIRSASTSLTILPGSFHTESGEMVSWIEDGEPARVDGDQLHAAYARGCAAILLKHHWPGKGMQHRPSLALAGGLLRAGWDPDDVERLLEFLWVEPDPGQIKNNVRTTNERVEKGELAMGFPTLKEYVRPEVVDRVMKWLKIGASDRRPQLNELGNAERFYLRHGRNVRYCKLWGSWVVWDGTRWRMDDTDLVREWAKDTVRAIADEAKAEASDTKREGIFKWAGKCQTAKAVDNMLTLVRSVRDVAVLPDEFDQQPWLFNVANGTLDLRTLELREARREDLITKVAPIAYQPRAECPTWRAFIRSAMQERTEDGWSDQPDMETYLQRLVGYAITGDNSEKLLPILYGPGDTGKTTFTELMLNLFGDDYSKTTTEETLTAKKPGSTTIPNDLAALRGARFVVISETPDGMVLNESRSKALTGRNRISARFMRQEWFNFVPEFKLFLETNHRPQIKGTDSAIWNRVKLIPFEHVIPKDQQDKALPRKLEAEMPGILNWALAGLVDWRSKGMQDPAALRDANEQYRAESDHLREFLRETCVVEDHGKTRSGELYRLYQTYMVSRGMMALGDQRFSEAMRTRGFHKKEVKGYGTWLGIRLRTETEKPKTDATPKGGLINPNPLRPSA